MDILTIGSLIVSALVLCWTVYRDTTSDEEELDARISTVETKVALMDQLTCPHD
ncbi:hypothetical protein [Enterobacter sp. RHBSTW-00975]|uniref:hypothetical protein n=1 Tax=Enterobacter sp. RHBSTW-00975 TaxID=2742673 RepID=UPI0015E57D91|nr:hypothetical protein [Enterobacter sp. RHBSTW-00975]QLO88704.1 hypothetical protein HV340_08830 [Enterobacter sp. RHBSTW-00975]